jgi:two-component system chemotaxis response regulator CheY
MERMSMNGSGHINKNMRILIVDDFANMRHVMRKTLLSLGFSNIFEAAGGEDAMCKIEAGEHFDFIISDWNMPHVSGLDLLKYVRAGEKIQKIPFLMITAEAKRDNIIDAAKAGVSQYIVKPFTTESLQEKIETIFAK